MVTKNINTSVSSTRDGETKKFLKSLAYYRMMQNPLGRKGWTIIWAQKADIKKNKKSVAKTFHTKLPQRRIITVHLKGVMSCAINPQNANSKIEYKIWINNENKVVWHETKSGSINHIIDKSISLIIPKGGKLNLTFQIEAIRAAVAKSKATSLRIEKGFTIEITKILSIDQSLIIPNKQLKPKIKKLKIK